jgi:hypothetical protein
MEGCAFHPAITLATTVTVGILILGQDANIHQLALLQQLTLLIHHLLQLPVVLVPLIHVSGERATSLMISLVFTVSAMPVLQDFYVKLSYTKALLPHLLVVNHL